MLLRFKLVIINLLTLLILSCGNKKTQKPNFSIETNVKENVFKLGETVIFSIKNPQNLKINNSNFLLDGSPITSKFDTSNSKLGIHVVTAKINYDDNQSIELNTKITIINNNSPKIYGYTIINEYPHDITSYTQGLEFINDTLYESTGQYGESKLRKVDFKTGKIIHNRNLPQQYFGEGLTILNDKIYQLTWRENIGFVYDLNSFEKLSSFKYGKSNEGWGLCNDGKVIYKSDGTENIWILNPETLAEEGKIQVYTNKGKIPALNELEWVDGKIYANIYQRNGVVIINPKNGAVEGVIDFSPLHKLVKQHKGLDVLNGIAYNQKTKTFFVTGKRWNKLFEVKLVEK